MENVMKCIIVLAIVIAGTSNFVFASNNSLVVRDTVIPDTTKQEVLLALNLRLSTCEVAWARIEASEIPETATKVINEKYEGYAIEEAYKGDDGQYKMVIKKEKSALIIIFDKDGKFISEVEK